MISQNQIKENEWISEKVIEMRKNGDLNDYVMLRIIKAIRYTDAVFFKIRMQGNKPLVQGFVKDRLVFSEYADGKVKDTNLILIKNLVYKNGYPTIDYKLMALDEAMGLI